ncbi:MAG: TonB-dependent receptor, partial [Bacteroidia bacterium]|nr:TonB-dependent receptor [Bacteroidia bacterium]
MVIKIKKRKMMLKQTIYIYLLFSLISVSILNAQENRKQTNDTLDTDVVNVVKPYTPKISDAFKIKEIPSLNDSTTTKKKEVKYNIFSIPVASTFTPAKGKAAQVDKGKKIRLYDNYATLGFGSYTSILGEVYLNNAISRTENVGGYLSHHSSQGGIDGVVLDDKFSDSKLRVNYSRNLKDLSWNVDAGYQHQVYNWYGVSPLHTTEMMLDDINPQHKFFTFDFGGEINFDDNLFNSAQARFVRFADDYNSAENRFSAQTNINVPIGGERVKTDLKVEYLGGTFKNDYYNLDKIKYGIFQVGIAPYYQIKEDDLTVNLGFSAYYLNDTEVKKSKFFIYPKITASYRLVDEVLISYAGIEGDLLQNSYHDFVNENPFMSPTLLVTPTDQQYNAYIGLKGKLSSNMSYNIRGNYYAEIDRALFKNNVFLNFSEPQNYSYGNSFNVVYDEVTT